GWQMLAPLRGELFLLQSTNVLRYGNVLRCSRFDGQAWSFEQQSGPVNVSLDGLGLRAARSATLGNAAILVAFPHINDKLRSTTLRWNRSTWADVETSSGPSARLDTAIASY